MPTTKLISSINDSVEKAMEKLTELRLTFQMKELNKQQQSASSALGTPLSDLTSSLSNLLTAAAVDLRSAVRLQKIEDEEREKHHHHHHNHNHVVGNCSECAVHNTSSSSSSQAFCIHKSALADRVIDRTFDQHKAMLREELKEVKSELEKFKSGAAYQTLRQRIDELELKLREEKMKKKKNEVYHRSSANDDDEEEKSERKQQFSINRNERDQIVSVSSFEEEKKRRQAKLIDKNDNDASGMFSLATVDDMIANFKNRCEDRAQKRREVEESVQLQREKEQRQQQEQQNRQKERIVEGEKSRKENKQLDTLLLNSLIRNFNNLLAAHRQEEAKIVERKSDLLFLFMSKIMKAKTHHEPHLPPLSATPRVPSAPQQQHQQENDEDGESLQKNHVITSGRRRNSSSSSSSRKKILDVTPKPLHEKMNSMMTTTSGRRW